MKKRKVKKMMEAAIKEPKKKKIINLIFILKIRGNLKIKKSII